MSLHTWRSKQAWKVAKHYRHFIKCLHATMSSMRYCAYRFNFIKNTVTRKKSRSHTLTPLLAVDIT